ncbi:DUF2255 family protein [Celeribacter naphthalenivorans]|uniref:DUF2255 family protein n=1 Tax=Celeribacter naphthalenivorans TaxID=1614694 RepID=UPI001CFAA21F|nr:DUF2255 family protein [Celeribacter naphthalenivorans]
MNWTKEQLTAIAAADDLRISPFREDGKTYGTPTFIWSVVVGDGLYVRPYNGASSRWYKAAMREGAGRISVAGQIYDVAFAPAAAALNDEIDAAYQAKYAKSSYLAPMISARTRAASVRITPR